MTTRRIMISGGSVRLAYGLAALLTPRVIAGRLAAAEPRSVMNLRGFGGQHVAIAVFTLLSSRAPQLVRPAVLLNVGVEVCDMTAGALEVRERGSRDVIAAGGVLLPLIGLAAYLTALHHDQRSRVGATPEIAGQPQPTDTSTTDAAAMSSPIA